MPTASLSPHVRKRHRAWHLVLASALAAVGLAPARSVQARAKDAAPKASAFGDHIDTLLDRPVFEEARVGVHVVDLESGKTLYQREPDQPLNPASNVKLFTTAAALLILGPAHRYATRLMRDKGALHGSTVQGDVYLVGSGDPSLVTEDLLALGAELRARGIRKVTGGVVVDSRRFDRDELAPGFDQKNELAAYRAPSGAASVNYNTFVVRASPGATVGAPALVGLDPPVQGIELTSTATTSPGRKRRLFADISVNGRTLEVGFRGTIGVHASAGRYRYPVHNPSEHAGAVVRYALRQNGIRIGRKGIRVNRAPDSARGLATHFSQPVSLLIRSINKFSNNFMAEQLLKTLDTEHAAATFTAACAHVRETLGARGVPLSRARLTNGSGLYDTNRVTPAQITALLAVMYADFRYRSEFLASLAVMGVDGTTRARLAGTEAAGWLRVKTGTLEGVSALSGYAGSPAQRTIAFSILFNELPRGASGAARAVQNEVARLASQLAAGRPLQSSRE